MRTYKKPMITVDSGLAEGVYAASGASQGTLNVTYHGVWDRWGTNGGKGLAMANWSDLNITFNDAVDQAETDDASVQTSWSGKTATFTFASTTSHCIINNFYSISASTAYHMSELHLADNAS